MSKILTSFFLCYLYYFCAQCNVVQAQKTTIPPAPPTTVPPAPPPPTTVPPPPPPPTTVPPPPPPPTTVPDYSVSVVASNVPSIDYEIDAIGTLQLALETQPTWTDALQYFVKVFGQRHDNRQWRLSSGCSYLYLPTSAIFIKMREAQSGTVVTVFD